MITVRPFRDENDPGWNVISVVYGNGDPVPMANRTGDRYVGERDGEAIATFTILELPVSFGPHTLRCAGIAAVGVLPHRRGGGVGTQLMAACVRECARQGYALSALYPFREPFYAKAGYASAGFRYGIEAPPDRIPGYANELSSRAIGPDDWEQLTSVQEGFARRYTGVAIRNETLWRRVLGENRALKAYVFGDPIEGWAVVSHKVDFWTSDRVPDIGWTTERGYRSVLAFLRRLGINKTGISWEEPTDGPFTGAFLDYGVNVKMIRTPMFRLLAPVPTRGEGSLVARVVDPILPELDGVWRIDGSGWTRSDATPNVTAEIGPMTQGVLGTPSFADLRRDGRVEGDWGGIYPPAVVYHPDFY